MKSRLSYYLPIPRLIWLLQACPPEAQIVVTDAKLPIESSDGRDLLGYISILDAGSLHLFKGEL